MKCILCKKKTEDAVCPSCEAFLRKQHGEEYESHVKLLLEQGGNNDAKPMGKTNQKRGRGGKRR